MNKALIIVPLLLVLGCRANYYKVDSHYGAPDNKPDNVSLNTEIKGYSVSNKELKYMHEEVVKFLGELYKIKK